MRTRMMAFPLVELKTLTTEEVLLESTADAARVSSLIVVHGRFEFEYI
jgi:hypothetical protein